MLTKGTVTDKGTECGMLGNFRCGRWTWPVRGTIFLWKDEPLKEPEGRTYICNSKRAAPEIADSLSGKQMSHGRARPKDPREVADPRLAIGGRDA